jgi:hypothetical protein
VLMLTRGNARKTEPVAPAAPVVAAQCEVESRGLASQASP